MTCASCDNPNPNGARFCVSCGAALFTTKVLTPPRAAEKESPVPPQPKRDESVGALAGVTIDGKYLIGSRIGTSGIGSIYRAGRLLIGDTVAIKVMAVGPAVDPVALERIKREAQATGRLNHQNIVATYDFGVSKDGYAYIVQELIEGKTLREFLKERERLDPHTMLDIARQVCAALEEAHTHKVIHRNIKPDNIILVTDDRGFQVKVSDFGLARLLDLSTGAMNLTPAGAIVGTPQYMSPEQCLGEPLDGRSDIYSLGIVIYEALCGAPPFDSPTATAVLIQHVESAPPPLRSVDKEISPAVEVVVMRALSKKRERRPHTARTFANELTAAVELGFSPQETAALYVTNENEALPDEEGDEAAADPAAVTRVESLTDLQTRVAPPPAFDPAPGPEPRFAPPPPPSDWDPSRASTGTLAGGSSISVVPGGQSAEGLYVAEAVAAAPHAVDHSVRASGGLATFAKYMIPLLLAIALAVAVVAGYLVKTYFDSTAARTAIVEQIEKGNLVSPEGSSAFDLYRGSQGADLNEDDKSAIGAAAVPALEERGNTIVARLRQEGTESADEWRQAIRVFTWLDELKPSPATKSRLHYAQARLAFMDDAYDKAIADYQRAIELDSSWALPFNGIGRAYGRLNDRKKAQEYYLRAAEIEPGWIISWLNYGSVSLGLGEYSEAEEAFRRAVEIEPDKPSPHNNLALALEKQGRACDALAEYRTAYDCALVAPAPGHTPEGIKRSIDRLAARSKCG
jgi:serine/threonine protein kinase/Tfp pilus assembly protein PilF